MKITEKQVYMLLEIAKNSIKLVDNNGEIFTFNDKKPLKLVNEILNQ